MTENLGNMSLLCLVDSSDREEYGNLQEVMWSALDFFGMPYEVFDLAKNSLSLEVLRSHSVIVIGQGHLGDSLSEEDTKLIVDAVKEGVGLVCFDGDLHRYKPPFKNALGLRTSEEPTHMPFLTTGRVRIWDNNHFITATKDLHFIQFNKPMEVGNVVNIEKEHRVLMKIANGSGRPALITETYGKGKVVLFAISPKIWMQGYLGHGGGLDDVFWKSIVWASRKPFAILAMPPFVTIRIDDCSGANDFEWIKILNKHGFIPHVSLFTDNIGEKGAKIIKELYDAELAEFSVHAFTYIKQVYWNPKEPLKVPHRAIEEGNEYSEDELKNFFKKLDDYCEKWGIKWSKVLVVHYGEIGKNVIPFLKERGIKYFADPYIFSTPLGKYRIYLSKLKRLKPFNGQGGIIDYHPDYPEFFIIESRGIKRAFVDFLGEASRRKVDVELIVRRTASYIKNCLDSLFPAVLVTHEPKISIWNSEEWDRLLSRIDELTSKYEKIYKSYSYIAKYAENLYNSQLTYANYSITTGEVQCRLEGESNMPLYLHIFKDKADWVERSFKEVPAYKGEILIKFKPKDLI